jgi:hypothetical protein
MYRAITVEIAAAFACFAAIIKAIIQIASL